MKYLGIDYGTKKVGLALSDDSGSLAFPHSVIPNNDKLQEYVKQLIESANIQSVVLGYSVGHDGVENPVMTDIHEFKENLIANGTNVYFEPEFFTTVQAKRNTSDAMADASAAALILQSFLDRKRF